MLCYIKFFLHAVFALSLALLLPAGAAQDSSKPMIYLDGAKAKLVNKGIGKQGGYLRNWNETGSGAKWNFEVSAPGTYYLFFESASASDQGGILEISIDGQKTTSVPVPHTKSFNDFKLFRFAEIKLTKGTHEITILCEKLDNKYLMDIKFGILSANPDAAAITKMLSRQNEYVLTIGKNGKPFPETFAQLKKILPLLIGEAPKHAAITAFKAKYPHQVVWIEQDYGKNPWDTLSAGEYEWDKMFSSLAKTSSNPKLAQKTYTEFKKRNPKADDVLIARLYEKLAWERRQYRLDKIRKTGNEIIFAKHHVFGSRSNIYLITETEGVNQPSSLCTLNLSEEKIGQFAQAKTLVDPGQGAVRNPELSWDAKKLLFAIRATKDHFDSTFFNLADFKRLTEGDPRLNYQIYEMDLETGKTRQLTTPETYGSNFEPCYLPNGDIMFSSARIVQHITCGWGDHSNLFIMNKDGKYARRIGFDQVNTAFPVVLNDGRVVFTRRDYNDRGQSAAHALFQMYSDGTGQTEFYGNQTGLPNTFQHTRPIPGSNKVITIIGGYHTTQGGKLAIIDTSKGVEKDQGLIEMPGYKKPRVGDGFDDYYGKQGEQFSYPYALSEKDYIVCIAERNARNVHYGIYYLNDMGERELLTSDPETSCLEPIMNIPRKRPPNRPTFVDYKKNDGVFYVQNVYHGEAAKGIKPGSVKKLRVIEIIYKNSTLGTSRGIGPGGQWDTVTASGHGLATFDSKRILGETDVYEDGSAMFLCPARKPVYFQLLDDQNRVIQTMRSWATLMPGENFSCVGCHENKNEAPMSDYVKTIAATKGAKKLEPFYGEPRTFSFIKEVQPVFDKHCVSCHNENGDAKSLILTAEPYLDDTHAKRRFYKSYHALTNARPENGHQPEEFGFHPNDKVWKRIRGKRDADEPNRYVSWYTRFELMKPYPPYRAGSIKSGLVKTLEKGHHDVKLSQEEFDKIKAWIDLNIPFAGEYDESNLWTDDEAKFYRARVNQRLRNEEIEARNIREFIKDGQPS